MALVQKILWIYNESPVACARKIQVACARSWYYAACARTCSRDPAVLHAGQSCFMASCKRTWSWSITGTPVRTAIPIVLGVALQCPQPVLHKSEISVNPQRLILLLSDVLCSLFDCYPLSTQQPVPSPTTATFNHDHLSKCCLKSRGLLQEWKHLFVNILFPNRP